MTQKTKQLKQFLTFTILAGFLFGCNIEEEHIKNQMYQEQINGAHIKFADLIKQQRFSTALSQVKPTKQTTDSGITTTASRTVMEVEYGFTITEDYANVIENDQFVSYTLLITRPNTLNTVFENLIIQTDKATNQTTAYILKYIGNSPISESSFVNGVFQGNRTIHPINYNPNQSNLADTEFCRWVKQWVCTGAMKHEYESDCTPQWGFNTYTEVCYTVSSGGGSPTTTTSPSPTQSGGGGNGTSAPINTNPNLPSLNEPDKEPCVKVEPLLNPTKANLKDKILHLRTLMTPEGEAGQAMYKDASGVYTPGPIGTSNEGKISYGPFNYNTFLTIHTHPTDSKDFPLFSFEDLQSLADIYSDCTIANQSEVAIILNVQINGVVQTYALTVNDISALLNAINNMLPNDLSNDEKAERLKQIRRSIANTGFGYVDKELAFLQFFRIFGVNLLKANSDLTQWEQVKLKRGSATATNPNGTTENIECN